MGLNFYAQKRGKMVTNIITKEVGGIKIRINIDDAEYTQDESNDLLALMLFTLTESDVIE